jgi:hypothetical protein
MVQKRIQWRTVSNTILIVELQALCLGSIKDGEFFD